jgi:hypothetical protein
MNSSSYDRDRRLARFLYVSILLLAVWCFVALVTVNWDYMATATKGHLITIWLMVAFALVAALYLGFAWTSTLKIVPWAIVILLAAIELMLALSYFNW